MCILCRVMDRRRFQIEDEVQKEYRRFNAVVSELTVRLLPPADGADPVTHFVASVCDLSTRCSVWAIVTWWAYGLRAR